MIFGSTPATAKVRILAKGLSPKALALSADMTTTADAASFRPELFPAVTVPPALKTAESLPRPSNVVCGRGCSSVSKIMVLFLHTGIVRGTIWLLNKPSAIALPIFCWLLTENSSCSKRVIWYFSAKFSAVTPIGGLPISLDDN